MAPHERSRATPRCSFGKLRPKRLPVLRFKGAEHAFYRFCVAYEGEGIGVGGRARAPSCGDEEDRQTCGEVNLHATKLQMRRIFAAAIGGPSIVVKHGPVVQGIE